ncbi:MAG TPA: hypothetical protein VN764_09895, partial [Polyangiaceae bacterium]|nr:hypothetical protein [Polyangiaceae bacterium]
MSEVTCPSAQLCTLGKAKECAVCRPNSYQCDGQVLKECNEDHTGYVEKATCTNPKEPCSETAGACSAYACSDQQKRCSSEGDVLEVCAQDRDKFIELKRCKSGLCDDAHQECDECVADTARCEDGERVTCDADGQNETKTPCDEATPYCVGAGSCVQCTQKEQCTADQCSAPVCESNSCSLVPAHSGEECSVGYCNAAGSCVQCLDPAQCPVNNDCYTPTCDGNSCGQTPRGAGLTCESDGGNFCDGSGSCVECAAPTNCSTSNDCYTPTCDGNSCGQTPRGAGLTCESDAGNFCDGSGSCVECVSPGQCSVDNDCYTPTCNGNSCGQTPRGAGLDCDSNGGNVCNGNGTCVACTLPSHCPQVTECFIRTCSNNICGQSPKARAVSCSGSNVCDGAGNCVPNVPYTVGESSASDWAPFEVPNDQWWIVPVTVPRTATLQGFRLIGESAGGQARMALWADDDGFPGAYIAQTNNFGMAQGVISQAPT